ncbi:FAD-binding oxidoreductase [Actinoplanes sp. Pm04-4]|uniref:FAD-binding oxidoreductase n=1 Tax=Paractinoplanes pyxinae TaxID=2997416 RepID=A0ABT4B4N8_9ACTN|nr:FAD-binding oxidoreductase [Actinoplanes pyxinae]MCY1141440.1 FAD-binding oxidoreductase [Actinoplanes pyxinae]
MQHRPRVVVGAASAADVQVAVRFAADRGLPVAVLATGHHAVVPIEDAVLITTHRMDEVVIDAAARTATVGAGVRWAQVVAEAARHGLAPLNGSSPLVGVVGYTLGGGISPTMGRRYGWAADHVESLDLVTADGRLRMVTAESDPDLFWAVRGGTSNFGVVTALTFRLFPQEILYAGGLFFDGAHAAAVLQAYAAWATTAPESCTSSVALLRLPPLPSVPEPVRGRFVVHVRIASVDLLRAQQTIEPLRRAAPLFLDTVQEIPYSAFDTIHADPVEPMPFVERSAMLAEFTAETVNRLLENAGPDTDVPVQIIELRHLGGAFSRQPYPANAVGNREALFSMWIVGVGGPDEAVTQLRYADELVGALASWTTGGAYINQYGLDDHLPQRIAAAYPEQAWPRLRAIKSRIDPTNTFRLNHNITPAAAG